MLDTSWLFLVALCKVITAPGIISVPSLATILNKSVFIGEFSKKLMLVELLATEGDIGVKVIVSIVISLAVPFKSETKPDVGVS